MNTKPRLVIEKDTWEKRKNDNREREREREEDEKIDRIVEIIENGKKKMRESERQDDMNNEVKCERQNSNLKDPAMEKMTKRKREGKEIIEEDTEKNSRCKRLKEDSTLEKIGEKKKENVYIEKKKTEKVQITEVDREKEKMTLMSKSIIDMKKEKNSEEECEIDDRNRALIELSQNIKYLSLSELFYCNSS